MKKLTVFLAVAVLVLSFGIANAGDGSKIPQSFQDQYVAATGTQATYAIWEPAVLELSAYAWSNYIIISNFNGFTISVSCEFTSYSNEQTTKTYTLPFFSKRIVVVGSEVGTDTIFDVYCLSSQLFGLTDLLFEGGVLSTAMPPIFIF